MGVISEEAETEVEKSNKVKDNEAIVDGVDKVGNYIVNDEVPNIDF